MLGVRWILGVVTVVGWSLLFIVVWQPRIEESRPAAIKKVEARQVQIVASRIQKEVPRKEKMPLQRLLPKKAEIFKNESCQMIDIDFKAVRRKVKSSFVKHDLLRRAETLCGARAACRRLGRKECAAFAWSGSQVLRMYTAIESKEDNYLDDGVHFALVVIQTFIDESSALPIFPEGGLSTLDAALAAYDANPRLQLSSTAMALYRAAEWRDKGGFAPKLFGPAQSHGYYTNDDSGILRTVSFEAGAISHESLMNNKILEVHQGLCLAKDRCAKMARCKAITYRLRDGVASLWATATPRSISDPRVKIKPMKSLRVLLLFTKTHEPILCPNKNRIEEKASISKMLDSYFDTVRIRRPAAAHDTINALPNITVSLTSLPGRLAQTRPVLESLLEQSLPPNKILVQVPTAKSRLGDVVTTLPEWLRGFDKRVEIRRPDQDYGPATKLIPTLRSGELHPDALLVVVDDDTLYSPRLLESFARWSLRFPDAALTATGWPATSNLRYPHWTENYLVYANELLAPHPVAVLRGNCAFATKPKFFQAELWTSMKQASSIAVLMDDVWFSGHLAARGIPRFAIPTDADVFTRSPEFSNVVTLDSKLGTSSASNKKQPPLNRVAANEAALRHFSKHWDVRWSPPKQKVSWQKPIHWRSPPNSLSL